MPGEGADTSWWRTWHDRDGASLPRLVYDAEGRTRQREEDDHRQRVKRRLAEIYARHNDLRAQYGIRTPPRGRPRRPRVHRVGSVPGKVVADFPDLVAEWAWDLNADLDPGTVAAGSSVRNAWRCARDHEGPAVIYARTRSASGCPTCYTLEASKRSRAGKRRARLSLGTQQPPSNLATDAAQARSHPSSSLAIRAIDRRGVPTQTRQGVERETRFEPATRGTRRAASRCPTA